MQFQSRSKRLRSVAYVTAICVVTAAASTPVEAGPELTDETISEKIDHKLRFDRGVTSSKIDVSASRGIVTLVGEVNNMLAKERAVRIAETIKGVRTVVDRIQVKPSDTRSDAEIQRDVESALVSDPATESYEITLSVQDGRVTIAGTVDSYAERELVKTAAKGVRGVTAIDDQIDVDFKIDRSDEEVKQDIKQALSWNSRVDDDLIDVSVSDGKVVLSGIVGSAAEKRLAEADAWVAGAEFVDVSKLSVEHWSRDKKLRGNKYAAKSKMDLQEAVKDALRADPRVFSSKVDVDVSGSIATLRGTVGSLRTKRTAEQDARNTVGITYVNNRLKVRLQNMPRDSEIAEDVREAVLRDPYVERFDIRVQVTDGTAHLYGIVDSSFEKLRADDLASRVVGVLDVQNHLKAEDGWAYTSGPYVDDLLANRDDSREYDRPGRLKTDAEIKHAIENELWWSPYINEDQVTVSVEGGIATLTGTVETWSESQAATASAYDGGAKWVDNDLTVRHE